MIGWGPQKEALGSLLRCHGDVASVALATGEAPRTSLKLAPTQSLETLLFRGY